MVRIILIINSAYKTVPHEMPHSKPQKILRPFVLHAIFLVSSFMSATTNADPGQEALDALGEKLFREGRFSQPALRASAQAQTLWSCATCHHTPDQVRGYADRERRSPVPPREDAERVTLRNSPALIELFFAETAERRNLLHFDGEFETPEDLVKSGFTGRNFGWLKHEKPLAIATLAKTIRQEYASDFSDPRLPAEFQDALLKPPSSTSDHDILNLVARSVAVYLRGLEFSKSADGNFNGSPYDQFLAQNTLPAHPELNESLTSYSNRLLSELEKLSTPQWIHRGPMSRHAQDFRFGPQELEGLKMFLRRESPRKPQFLAHQSKIGNCASCHSPPAFTDFSFRNTGVSQEEYDKLHGHGAFSQLRIPTFRERVEMPLNELTDFAAIPTLETRTKVDLGAWATLRLDRPHHPLLSWLCLFLPGCQSADAWNEEIHQGAIAAFKTPTLRNLGQSEPYLHNGSRDSLESVVRFYAVMGVLA
ncbi:MAG: hypothetical protein RJB38_1134, partial [Pseudomonadota bacterium]